MPTHLITDVPLPRLRAAQLCVGAEHRQNLFGVTVFDDRTVAATDSYCVLVATRHDLDETRDSLTLEHEFIAAPLINRIVRSFHTASTVDLQFEPEGSKLHVMAGSFGMTVPWRPIVAPDMSLFFSDTNEIAQPFTLNIDVLDRLIEAGKILGGSGMKTVRFHSMGGMRKPLTFTLQDGPRTVGHVVQMPVA